jgi:muramoyltetrapeptide carboxypeptidase
MTGSSAARTAPRTAGGLLKFRPVRRGSRVALVAPASSFKRDEFDAGLDELRRLGFDPVFEERIFERHQFGAGSPLSRARELSRAWARADIDALIAVRGGYGSLQILPLIDPEAVRSSRTAFVGYSDVTSLHVMLGCHVGLTSVHGPMVEGRLSKGKSGYDPASFLRSLGNEPLGELSPTGLDVIQPGEARGALFGGTLTQLLSALGTPYEFRPPVGHLLLIDDVGERPYRLHRMLTQWRLTGRLSQATGVLFSQMPGCDEPARGPTARDVVADVLADFPGPVIFGFPTGHSVTPLVTLPLGVGARLIAGPSPRLVVEEAAAGD